MRCECGCGEEIKPSRRYVKGHNSRLRTPPYKLAVETGCWIWQRALGDGRYGVVNVPGQGTRAAHRVVYEDLVGPIPPGLETAWVCDDTRCCNPAHVRLVSRREVVRRGKATKLSAEDIDTIRVHWRGGMPDETVARVFGVSTTRVRQVTRGKDADTVFTDR